MGRFDGYLFVSDMDATLLSDDHTVSEQNRRAIEYFIENGGLFTVASGRMVDAVRAYLHSIPINAPAVLHNGAKLYDFENEKTLYEQTIEEERKEIVRRVHDDMPELGIEVHARERVYVYRRCGETERFKKTNYKVEYTVPPEMWGLPWTKTLFIADKEVIDVTEPVLRGKYRIGNILRSGDMYLDMMANGVSKGTGVKRLAELCGIEMNKVIAVGDNMNDVDMLKAAGRSFAVANAMEAAKQAADSLAPDNNDNAIEYIIKRGLF